MTTEKTERSVLGTRRRALATRWVLSTATGRWTLFVTASGRAVGFVERSHGAWAPFGYDGCRLGRCSTKAEAMRVVERYFKAEAN